MKTIVNFVTVAAVVACIWENSAFAGENAVPPRPNNSFKFGALLANHPFELHHLLGRHLDEVVPGQEWVALPTPEEYRNPAIKYGVFVRGNELHDYMRHWDFLTEHYCVSDYSMFLLYFNEGFVFKVELRYIRDSFTGNVKPDDPAFCGDEMPIFRGLAKEMEGTVNIRQGRFQVKEHARDYVVTLSADENDTSLVWELRGGPSF